MWHQSCTIIMVSPASGVHACWVLGILLHNNAAGLPAEANTAHTGRLLAWLQAGTSPFCAVAGAHPTSPQC